MLRRLADEAQEHGISNFTASVMWENHALLDGLRAFGAEVTPSEPGVASIRIALPDPETSLPDSHLHHALRIFAARVHERIGLRFDR